MPSELVYSVISSPQPPRPRITRRKSVSVTPAIGASTAAGRIVKSRIWNDAGIMGLSVPQPEQKSPETTQYKRAQKEPPELRDSYQSHQNKAKHYYQTDGMSTPFACAVAAEWQNLDGVRFG